MAVGVDQKQTLSYPLRLSEDGKFVASVSDEERDQTRLLLAIGTNLTERVMQPELGQDMLKLFYLNGEDQYATITDAVNQTVIEYFPHMKVRRIMFSRSRSGHSVTADIYWSYAVPPNPQSTREYLPSFHAVLDVSGLMKSIEDSFTGVKT